ncbi:MAG: YraN family protein [Pseudomonadota bacterium]
MKNRRQRAEQQGRKAETAALLLLLFKGYWPLARRAKTPRGEIDLIVRRGQQLVLVEVKNRAHIEAANEAVSGMQQQRIMDAFYWWLARHPRYSHLHTRCDVVLSAPGRFPKHIANAFSA